MSSGHNLPPVIPYELRHTIGDVVIPLDVTEGGKMICREALLSEAYCYCGKAHPYRVFDGSDPALANWFISLYAAAENAAPRGAKNWRVEHEGKAFRAHYGVTVRGPDLILRTLPDETPRLDQLNMPPAWRTIYLDSNLLYGGLVLVTAKNGMGKTTTVSAAIRSRLEAFGGHANTVEDPPELPLHGFFGRGACRQIPVGVDREGDDADPGMGFAEALIHTRREFPSMTGGGTILMIGEIRDNRTAAETLKAAFEGHLVLATFHSASIQHALMRLVSMAGEEMGHEQARQLLSATLRAAFHQTLTVAGSGEAVGWGRGVLQGKALVVPVQAGNIHAEIEAGDFMDKVKARVDEQNKRLGTLPPNCTIADVRNALADS